MMRRESRLEKRNGPVTESSANGIAQVEVSGQCTTDRSNGEIIAIPSAHTVLGETIIKPLLDRGNRLALGAGPAQFRALDTRIDGCEGAHCQPVDLDSPKSMHSFFQIAHAQLGKIDAIIFEALPPRGRCTPTARSIEIGTRRLVHCLDAVVPYLGDEMHIISINSGYGLAAIPVARAFLDAKFAATGKAITARIRISVVCPSPSSPLDEVSLANSVVHVVSQSHCPDISVAILTPGRKIRGRQIVSPVRAPGKVHLRMQ
jgi:hypothetical protein